MTDDSTRGDEELAALPTVSTLDDIVLGHYYRDAHAGLEAMLGPNDDPPLPLFVASPEVELRPSRAARDRKRSSVRAVLPTHVTRKGQK